MKRYQWATAIMLVAFAQCANADSVSNFKITQVTAVVFVNAPSDNVYFGLTGPGTNITGVGEIVCEDSWCNAAVFFSPGTSIYPNIGQILIANFDSATVGGNPATDISFTSGFAIDVLGNLTLPTNSQSSFSACVPATMSGPIGGFVMNGNTPALISLTTPTGGSFCTTWNLNGSLGQYEFAQGQFVASTVPEPGTFGLMGSGVAALFGAALRRRYKNDPKWRLFDRCSKK